MTRRYSESRSDEDTARIRLAALGATVDEITEFMEAWDRFDADWTPETRKAWVRQADASLLEELAAIRMEYHLGTHTEAEDVERGFALQVDGYASDAFNTAHGTIRDVLAWVDDDPARAEAAVRAELARVKPRPTLIAQLQAV